MVTEKLIGKYVIIRTLNAGVFAGLLEAKDDTEVTLSEARRIWYWSGAASLSQLAIDGVSKPDECKFPEPLSMIIVLGVIEIIPCTKKARNSIEKVPIWKV